MMPCVAMPRCALDSAWGGRAGAAASSRTTRCRTLCRFWDSRACVGPRNFAILSSSTCFALSEDPLVTNTTARAAIARQLLERRQLWTLSGFNGMMCAKYRSCLATTLERNSSRQAPLRHAPLRQVLSLALILAFMLLMCVLPWYKDMQRGGSHRQGGRPGRGPRPAFFCSDCGQGTGRAGRAVFPSARCRRRFCFLTHNGSDSPSLLAASAWPSNVTRGGRAILQEDA